ncbi:MAG: lysylphosphatidylglycerol synthase transmembrane domain-containing protein [Nanoarchaeota archaeon]|nr:flippase-like domain-containing protein [Nanoarchaeota archaeon]MBU1029786.1 flippase-like domain-containing protein [Nanoarchaeota archaeon]MBU1850299.1 flippase-like domain-containing protein [Nanoarchaeota archaeon]
MDKKKVFSIFKILFGVIVFALILKYKFDFSVFTKLSFHWQYLAMMIVVSLIINVVRAWKWNIILTDVYKQKFSFSKIFRSTLVGQFFAFFTPSRLGDFIRAKHVKKELGYKKAISSLVIERASDVLIMLLFFLYGLLVLKDEILKYISLKENIWIFAIIIFACILVWVIFHKKIHLFVKENFQLKHLKKPLFLTKLFLITLVVWFLTYVQFFFASKTLGVNLQLFLVLAIASIHAIILLLPITINGIGLREGSSLILFPLIGITSNVGIILAWLVALNNSLLPAILGYVTMMFKNPK